MATQIVLNELIKKKDELALFINKLESIIEHKKEEIYHIENTITIFKKGSPSPTYEKTKEKSNPNIIKYDFTESSEIIPDTKVNDSIKKAIKTQKNKEEKLHTDEKEILKQFKQLMRG